VSESVGTTSTNGGNALLHPRGARVEMSGHREAPGFPRAAVPARLCSANVRPLDYDSKQMSPKKIIAISLLVWFVPFVPLVFIFGHDLSARHLPACVSGMVFLTGAAISYLVLMVLRLHAQIPDWLAWCLGILTPASFTVLTLLTTRWREYILIAGFILAAGLSWCSYMLMRA